MKTLATLLTLGLLVGLAGCTQTNAGRDNVNAGVPSLNTKKEIIEHLGVPDGLIHDADGTVLIYEHTRVEGMNLQINVSMIPVIFLGNEQKRADRVEFQCDANGRLTGVTTFQGTDAIDRAFWPF